MKEETLKLCEQEFITHYENERKKKNKKKKNK